MEEDDSLWRHLKKEQQKDEKEGLRTQYCIVLFNSGKSKTSIVAGLVHKPQRQR